MIGIWLRSLSALWVCLFVSVKAAAQTTVLIVVQRESPVEVTACEQQLRSELLAAGYSPSTVQVIDKPTASVLVDTTKQLAVPAAISIVPNEGKLAGLVWLTDPDEPGGLLRAIEPQAAGEQTAAVFAVKATNLLEGAMLELGYPSQSRQRSEPPAPEPGPAAREEKPLAPTPPAPKVVSARAPATRHPQLPRPRQWRHEWTLQLGAGALLPLRHQPAASGGTLAFNRRLGRHWALGVAGHLYLPTEAQGDRANVHLYQFIAGARLDYRQYLGSRVTLYESSTTGAHFTKVNGRASESSGLENKHPYAYTLCHLFGFGGVWHATADFGLWSQASVFVAWQKSDVVVVSDVVATMAGPAILVDLGMQMSF